MPPSSISSRRRYINHGLLILTLETNELEPSKLYSVSIKAPKDYLQCISCSPVHTHIKDLHLRLWFLFYCRTPILVANAVRPDHARNNVFESRGEHLISYQKRHLSQRVPTHQKTGCLHLSSIPKFSSGCATSHRRARLSMCYTSLATRDQSHQNNWRKIFSECYAHASACCYTSPGHNK